MKKKFIYMCLLSCVLVFSFVLNVQAWWVTPETLQSHKAYQTENPFTQSGYRGQCTWYVWGRMYEKTGVKIPTISGDAGSWWGNVSSKYKTTTLQENVIIVIGPNEYSSVGHVAFVEKIEGNQVYISEGNATGYATHNDYVNHYREQVKDISRVQVGAMYYDTNHGTQTGEVLGYITNGEAGSSIPTYVPDGSIQDLGKEFAAYITPSSKTNLAVGATVFKQAGNVTLQNKGSDATKWKFIRQSDGSYFIQNQANTNYYLDVSNNGNANMDNVYVWDCHGGDKMRWYVYNYNGAYRLVPKSANRYKHALDIKDNNINNGANVEIYEALKNDNSAQTFKIEKILYRPSGNYIDIGDNFVASIVSKSNTNLAVGATEYKQSGNVTLQNKGSKATKWKFIRQSDGSYFIQNQGNTDYYLDTAGNGNVNGDNVYVWTRHGSNKMRWYIYNYNGGYRLVPKNAFDDKLALDITDNNINNGANIEIYEALRDTNGAQTFLIEKDSTINSLNINTPMVRLGVGATMTAQAVIDGTGDFTCSWTSGDSSIFSITNSKQKIAYVTGEKAGETILLLTCGGKSVAKRIVIFDPNVSYQTQVQNKGWLSSVTDGKTSGTVGSGLRMESLKVSLANMQASGNIEYRSHIQNIGWESSWKKNGEMSGTTGKGLRLEAIQMKLSGTISNYYDIYYRVHVQNFGWLGWAKNGASAGSSGYGYRVEAVETKLVRKGGSAPGSTANSFKEKTPAVNYKSQVQNIGWMGEVKNGTLSGTSGKGYRLETIQARITNSPYAGGIEYRSHIQNIGWESTWKKNGANSGTTGKGLRLEAIQMRLTGDLAKNYDVYYRVHVQNFGWLGWAKNGASAGSSGYGYRIEGVQIKLVKKGGSAPGTTANTFKQKR